MTAPTVLLREPRIAGPPVPKEPVVGVRKLNARELGVRNVGDDAAGARYAKDRVAGTPNEEDADGT